MLILFFHYHLNLSSCFFSSAIATCIHSTSLPRVLHALPISSSLTYHSYYIRSSTSYEAPHFAVFPSFLLFRLSWVQIFFSTPFSGTCSRAPSCTFIQTTGKVRHPCDNSTTNSAISIIIDKSLYKPLCCELYNEVSRPVAAVKRKSCPQNIVPSGNKFSPETFLKVHVTEWLKSRNSLEVYDNDRFSKPILRWVLSITSGRPYVEFTFRRLLLLPPLGDWLSIHWHLVFIISGGDWYRTGANGTTTGAAMNFRYKKVIKCLCTGAFSCMCFACHRVRLFTSSTWLAKKQCAECWLRRLRRYCTWVVFRK